MSERIVTNFCGPSGFDCTYFIMSASNAWAGSGVGEVMHLPSNSAIFDFVRIAREAS
jgi:hypothetical protein